MSKELETELVNTGGGCMVSYTQVRNDVIGISDECIVIYYNVDLETVHDQECKFETLHDFVR